MHSSLTSAEIERLAILIEECSEVIKASTKILRHGYTAYDKGVNYDNRKDLQDEIGDVLNAIDIVYKARDIDMDAVHMRVNKKLLEGVITHYQDS